MMEDVSHLCVYWFPLQTNRDGSGRMQLAIYPPDDVRMFNPSEGMQGMIELAREVQTSSTIRALNLTECQLGQEAVWYLADGLVHNGSVDTLVLRSNCLERYSCQWIVWALLERGLQSRLTRLDLSHNRIDACGAAWLATGLRESQCLQCLDLSHNRLDQTAAEFLADALLVNRSLVFLTLDRNPIGLSGAMSLTRALEANATLGSFFVDYASIGQFGTYLFANMLRVNRTLRGLFIWNLGSNPDCIAYFCDAMSANASLVCLGGMESARDNADVGRLMHLLDRNLPVCLFTILVRKLGSDTVCVSVDLVSLGGNLAATLGFAPNSTVDDLVARVDDWFHDCHRAHLDVEQITYIRCKISLRFADGRSVSSLKGTCDLEELVEAEPVVLEQGSVSQQK